MGGGCKTSSRGGNLQDPESEDRKEISDIPSENVAKNSDKKNCKEDSPKKSIGNIQQSGNKSEPSEKEISEEERISRRKERLEQWRRERLEKQSLEKQAQGLAKAEVSNSQKKSPEKETKDFSKPTIKFALATKPAQKMHTATILRPKFAEFEDDNNVDDKSKRKKRKIAELLHSSAENNVNKHRLKTQEEDPLDKYMCNVDFEVMRINGDVKSQGTVDGSSTTADNPEKKDDEESKNSILMEEQDDTYVEEVKTPEGLIEAARKKAAAKRKDIALVDHSTIQYEPFRKNFLIEPPSVASMTNEEVNMRRLQLDGIKVRGQKCPKPIEKWTQFGLPTGCAEVIRSVLKYEKPTPIQCQAIPAIMAGRDVTGIAKTGSGKTIAFLLPMFRHIKDQRPLEPMEGPIALIMTPTRELAVQIHKECRNFTKVMGMRSVCCYGGSHIKEQIAELKRGAEILIGTPGRIIDLLCANNGRVTNLRRVTYLVLDEADRMFDMGFEPQVMRIVLNIRPGRQNVLFSATFPGRMEALARKILHKPLEITVGGKSVVAGGIEQVVEIRSDEDKFLRLLEILGKVNMEDPESKVLIFVDRQEAADTLLKNLFQRGYPCQSLHGGKDQADRDSTISDFKSGNTNVLIATSVASRGLDVKHLKVVINYDCPNHMEDYIHRVGRTGRAGMKGTAYTFITPIQEKYAVDIVNALVASGTQVPPEIQSLADKFLEKVKAGTANLSFSGFGGKGLEKLEHERDIVKIIQKKAHGAAYADDDDDDETIYSVIESDLKKMNSSAAYGYNPKSEQQTSESSSTTKGTTSNSSAEVTGVSKAREIIAGINARLKDSMGTMQHMAATPAVPLTPAQIEVKKQASDSAFSCEIEINDYPQKARWRVTNKEQISQITEISGAAITTRGTFFLPGKQPGPGDRKLYLFIEGDNQLVIDKANAEIKRILAEATIASIESEASGSRYTVV